MWCTYVRGVVSHEDRLIKYSGLFNARIIMATSLLVQSHCRVAFRDPSRFHVILFFILLDAQARFPSTIRRLHGITRVR